MTQKAKVCPACEGRGLVSERDESAEGHEVLAEGTCPRCAGTGEVLDER